MKPHRKKKKPTNKKAGTSPKGRKKSTVSSSKVFLGTFLVLAVAGGGYLVYERLRRKPTLIESGGDPDIVNNALPAQTTSAKVSASRNDSFPLKRGSRGTRVRQLQQALAERHGIDMTSYGGIDGEFGPGTASALMKAGYDEVIYENTFKAIVGGSTLVSSSAAMTQAKSLYAAAREKNVAGVINALKAFKSTGDYAAVNSYYKDLFGRTIVTDLLDYAFPYDEAARNSAKTEFLRMGLKVNASGIWSLQGLSPHRDVITMRPTFVIDKLNNRIPVEKNTILGDEVRVANGITWVKSIDNTLLQVPTQDVKYV
jgi:hypothetical protein